MGLGPKVRAPDPLVLGTNVFGVEFPNPVGLAAGFDKNAQVPDAMIAMGFGFVEVGTITPRIQPGNPRPRLFRLEEDQAVINRLGFNNEGLEAATRRLKMRSERPGIIGVNVGANKTSADWIEDYVEGIRTVYSLADYVAVNISSPNTPGLRSFQDKAALDDLLTALMETRANVTADRETPTPLVLKVAPDLEPQDVDDISEVIVMRQIDGLIVGNTTIGFRTGLQSKFAREEGGLSGAPLFEPSTEILQQFYRATGGHIPLIGVGGISSGEQAYKKIRAGASLVQLYSALTYQGPDLVNRIKRDLTTLLLRDGFGTLSEAVGTA
jgi:dihydroorotate dehydrogenase